jgi:hypothetical protein
MLRFPDNNRVIHIGKSRLMLKPTVSEYVPSFLGSETDFFKYIRMYKRTQFLPSGRTTHGIHERRHSFSLLKTGIHMALPSRQQDSPATAICGSDFYFSPTNESDYLK